MTLKTTFVQIIVELEELPAEREWPELAVYVFTPSGRLVKKEPIVADARKKALGQAEFKIEEEAEELVVKVGPDVESLSTLGRYQLPSERIATASEKVALAFKLPKPHWWCWIKVPYVITGTVEKQTATGQVPVCVGEVDIYDVDLRHCFPRLPELIIEKIREAMIDIILDPPPIQENPVWPAWDDGDGDWCGTGPKPPFPPHVSLTEVAEKLATLPAEWDFAKKRFARLPSARSKMDLALGRMALAEKQALLDREAVAGVRISDVLYSNTVQFRDLLFKHFQAFRFWLCWYPWIHWLWWPFCRWYSLEYLGTTQLKPDGSFSKTIRLWICRRDTPDLWFVVRQTIGGIERVIYARRPVPCHTYWNHPSGDPVHLHVTDPAAVACDPQPDPGIPGLYVMPWGIGTDKWYAITQAHRKPPALPDPNRGLYGGTAPYGTTLHLRMQFHDLLRAHNVLYYRWSYRKEGNATWTRIDTPIFHSYLTTDNAGKPIINYEKIGPYPATVGPENDLFLVPDPQKIWVYDRVFAIWDTSKVADGKYELYLEMFDANGSKIADPIAAGFTYFLPTGPAPSPVDDQLHIQNGGVVFQIHVDNTPTKADVQAINLAGNSDTYECKFIGYNNTTDVINITYAAYQANGYLQNYSLSILRGVSGTSVASLSDTTPVNPATYQRTVGDLLRLVNLYGPYERCTFAVELHTYPRHRNGYTQIRAYEDHDTATFALVKL